MLPALIITAALLTLPASAASGPTEDVAVPGGLAALARALGIDAPDRARAVAEIARLVYADVKDVRMRPGSTFRRLIAHLESAKRSSPSATPAVDRVPMPLPARVWSEAVFHRPVAPADLFAAVLSDPAAALLAHGLAALDDETLLFLAAHPALVTTLYARDAAIVSAFAAHLRIRDNRVVPPGGDRAVPLWEAVLRQRVTRPESFVRELFARSEGHLAYLYDTIGHLDASRAAFALGFWIDDPAVRVERFTALALATSSLFGEWDARKRPFSRPPHDLLSMLTRMHATESGRPVFAAPRSVWTRAFSGGDLWEERTPALDPTDGEPADAAWLTGILMGGHSRWRQGRLDQFAFAQRTFATADAVAMPDVVLAIRTFPQFRMLMLTLERIGVTRPALYVALARQAERISALEGIRGRVAITQFQGAIALIARLAQVGTIDRAGSEALLARVSALPFDEKLGYRGAFVPWLQSDLRRLLTGDGVNRDGWLLAALAGPPGRIPVKAVSWEGQAYRFDLAASEAARLRRFLERQGGPSIDLAFDLHRIAQTLPPRVADRVFDLVDLALADALLSLSYAVAWSEPPGTQRTARNVARRHDFGNAMARRDTRARMAWAMPFQTFGGAEWRVQGSILGLDAGLASLALRRITADPPPAAPAISSTERDTFVVSLGLMNPFALEDATQHAIGVAVARGQRRIETLRDAGADVDAVVREIAMDGWRARALGWTIAHEPQRIGSLFSLTDLLYLGGGRDLDLAPWGMSAMYILGCLCTQIPPPGLHTALVGRMHLGLLATTVADLHLRVAVTLHELGMPAPLAREVLAAAVQHFVDRVKPSDPDDWLALVRAAQSVSRERIEDYLAAATSGGPLLPAPTAVRGRLP